jgi:hypothetical protein
MARRNGVCLRACLLGQERQSKRCGGSPSTSGIAATRAAGCCGRRSRIAFLSPKPPSCRRVVRSTSPRARDETPSGSPSRGGRWLASISPEPVSRRHGSWRSTAVSRWLGYRLISLITGPSRGPSTSFSSSICRCLRRTGSRSFLRRPRRCVWRDAAPRCPREQSQARPRRPEGCERPVHAGSSRSARSSVPPKRSEPPAAPSRDSPPAGLFTGESQEFFTAATARSQRRRTRS